MILYLHFFIRFFSNLVGEKGPRIPGVKDPRVYFLETLSASPLGVLDPFSTLFPLSYFLFPISYFLAPFPFILYPSPLTPCPLWNHIRSIGNDPHILPQLTTTNREMILLFNSSQWILGLVLNFTIQYSYTSCLI